ncbi:MAG: energy transducer TonB [Bacteroidales bacterium]|nr:energy transducer TonB [Bacteroidales bacterium]
MALISDENRAGLYITVIVHLSVIIILLLTGVSSVLGGENSFVIDFSREEAMEKKAAEAARKAEEEAFDDAISRRLDQLLSGTSGVQFRNVATDRSALKDDRGTDADKLYEDARRLAEDLKGGVAPDEPDEDYASVSPVKKEDKKVREYSGPSVVSYTLDGRKASRLPIPAYRCYGGGMVTVLIKVNNNGDVIDAKVQEEISSPDKCLRDFAVRAARMSKFSKDAKAPARQAGDIVYQFIAQ